MKNNKTFLFCIIMIVVKIFISSMSIINLNINIFGNILIKIFILIFDIICLIYLRQIFKQDKNKVTYLYFSSPIILYSAYIKNSLDIITVTIFMVAVYYLIKNPRNNYILISVFTSFAMITDIYILIIIPIVFIYIYKKTDIKILLNSIFIFCIISLICIFPIFKYDLSNALYNYSNLTNNIVNAVIYIGQMPINIFLLSLIIIYLNVLFLNSINKNLFFGFCTITIICFFIMIKPEESMYVWLVPFICAINNYEGISNNKHNIAIFYAVNFIYIIYFNLQSSKYSDTELTNFVYTVFVAITIFISYVVYSNGVYSNKVYKRRGMPVAIGISGDSSSGKTTLSRLIKNNIFKNKVLLLEGDDDHKWERGNEHWKEYTHLNPKANFLYKQALDIKKLKKWESVTRAEYDHTTGKFTKERVIYPKKYILINGLHTLYLPQMRDNLDFKIYMDASKELKTFWKLQRDSKERKQKSSDILKNIEDRENDYKKYIIPQSNYADMIIYYYDENIKIDDYYNSKYEPNISLKITFSSDINIDDLIEIFASFGIDVYYDFLENLDKQVIIFRYENFNKIEIPFNEIINKTIPNIDDLWINEIESKNNTEGLIQIMFLVIISRKLLN